MLCALRSSMNTMVLWLETLLLRSLFLLHLDYWKIRRASSWTSCIGKIAWLIKYWICNSSGANILCSSYILYWLFWRLVLTLPYYMLHYLVNWQVQKHKVLSKRRHLAMGGTVYEGIITYIFLYPFAIYGYIWSRM